jgi:apolipoprotein N-acyltransferase
VALIQGSLDTVFVAPTAESIQQNFDHFRKLTAEAVKQQPNLDLVAWPESAFAVSETLIEEPLGPQQGLSAEETRARLNRFAEAFHGVLADDAALTNSNTDSMHAGTKLLVGTTTEKYGPVGRKIFNTALLADRSGNIAGRYAKTHPVMFGEYVPLAEYVTWLNHVTPIATGLSIGDGPTVFDVGGLKMSPSICFESTIPHLIRGQLATLQRRGTPADVLINVTNDGWFWGSGMLDLHFRCGVFRAVENRKPLVVVANTGISTFVDGNGAILQRGPRRQATVLLAEVTADGRRGLYSVLGDIPAWLCAAACVGLVLAGIRKTVKPEPAMAQGLI